MIQLYPVLKPDAVVMRDVAFVDRHGKTVIVVRNSDQVKFEKEEVKPCH